MILYQLSCAGGHRFEAWFKNSETYGEQCESGCIECPQCGDQHISKAPMAPYLGKSLGEERSTEARAREVAQQILKAVERLRVSVEKNSDYVGDQFAEEARRIHYGEADKRSIFGEATGDETSELDEEGIEYFRLPSAPRKND